MDPQFNNPLGKDDPYLVYQPNFARSLPVQILLNGVIVTLVMVLLIHLLFTAHSHWPLARLNYALQLSGVITLLISLITSIVVVLDLVHSGSRGWPYMLDYIAVDIPPGQWTTREKVLWYLMEAITSGFAHITNIQTLTLLFPAKIEQRLIFLLLGPLALSSSAMTFSSLSPHPRAQDLGDAIRGICNSTLSLLFTFALFVWGFYVNRKRAWRTDGGTAAFGAGACLLAVMSVVVNFVLIFEDQVVWLPYMNWTVVLWQSFLGWWWFAGSGMGIGEVDDMLYRVEYDKLKKPDRERGQKGRKGANADARVSGHRFTGSLIGSSLSRRRGRNSTDPDRDATTVTPDNIEMQSMRLDQLPEPPHSAHGPASPPPRSRFSAFLHSVPFAKSVSNFINELRDAHIRETAQHNPRRGGEGEGWALGNYGLVQREEAERRIMEFKERRRNQRLLNNGQSAEIGEREEDWEDEEGDVAEEERMAALEMLQREVDADSSRPSPPERNQRSPRRSPSPSTLPSLPDPLPPSGSIFWWWGPLRRWRLQDRTVYN